MLFWKQLSSTFWRPDLITFETFLLLQMSLCLESHHPPNLQIFLSFFFSANHDSHPGKQKKDIINQPKMHRWWLQTSINKQLTFFYGCWRRIQKHQITISNNPGGYEEIWFTKQIPTNHFFRPSWPLRWEHPAGVVLPPFYLKIRCPWTLGSDPWGMWC